jgi:hypothetical protein
VKRPVQIQNFGGEMICKEMLFFECHLPLSTAPLLPHSMPGMFDEDLSHDTGRRTEEICAALDGRPRRVNKLEVRLMYERRRRERVTTSLPQQVRVSHAAQLVVNQRQQLIYGILILRRSF